MQILSFLRPENGKPAEFFGKDAALDAPRKPKTILGFLFGPGKE